MKWYDKYLSVFEKPFDNTPQSIIDEVREKVKTIQSDKPLASVVVIAHNEESTIVSCIWSLCESKCKYPFEIIGVDNDSKDRTAEVFKSLGVPCYNEKKKSSGYARSRGQQEAKGKYYLCIDSDTLYPNTYVETMIDALEKPGIVAVSALYSYVPSKDFPRFWMRIYEFMRDVHLYAQSFNRPELSARGAVFGYVTELGRQVGYRVWIKRGEDGAMAMDLRKFGKIKIVLSSKARAFTSTRSVQGDGNMFKALISRMIKAIKGGGRYFTKREVYKDQDSNIVKD